MAVCINGDRAMPVSCNLYNLRVAIDFSRSAFFVGALDEVVQVVGDMIIGAWVQDGAVSQQICLVGDLEDYLCWWC